MAGGKFGIKINPELILKLTEPEKKPLPPPPPPAAHPFFPKQSRKKTVAKSTDEIDGTEASKPSAINPKQTLIIPPQALRPAPPPLPPLPHPAEDEALLPFKKTVAECEELLERLKIQESEERRLVQERARELSQKEYQAPRPKPLPCPQEKKDCVECLSANPNDPLKCRDSVKAYALCAQQVRHRFVSSAGFSSNPQVNS